MMKTLLFKELLENFSNKRFFITLVLCLLVIPLGFYVSYKDYQSRLHDYQESVRIYEADIKDNYDLVHKGAKGFRQPSPMSFISIGLELFLPTVIQSKELYVTPHLEMRMSNNQNMDNPYMFFHGQLDLAFIVSVIMTFLAMVFTYNSINGEKERGTLRQILSNSVPRYQIIFSKIGANFVILIIPFFIALIFSLLILQYSHFPIMDQNQYLPQFLCTILFSLLLIGAFFNLGLMVSALTNRSITAIVILLFSWIVLFGIFPRVGVILAQLIYPVKSQQTVELEKNQIRLNNEKECEAEVDKLIAATPDQRHPPREFYDKQDAIRVEYRKKLVSALQRINQDMEMRQRTQSLIVVTIARLSPLSCFVRSISELANTGLIEYEHFLQKADEFQNTLNTEVYYKIHYTRHEGGVSTGWEGHGKSAASRFIYSKTSFQKIIVTVFPDALILVLYNILFFTIAFVAFLRYDVR